MIQRSRRVSPSAKAVFHNISGAGKSRVVREFFNLSERELDTLARDIEEIVKSNLHNG